MRLFLILLLGLLTLPLTAQEPQQYLAPSYPHHRQDDAAIRIVDRTDILGHAAPNLHTALRRYEVTEEDTVTLRKGWLSTFYKDPGLLYGVSHADYKIGVNFFFDLRVGQDMSRDEFIFLNKRGVELFGELDDKLYFYSCYEENQSNFLDYKDRLIDDYKAIRGKGNYKPYQSGVIDKLEGYDYGFATAYLGYKLSKHAVLEIGHNRHHIGNGIRSLLLSAETNNYFNVRLAARFWKIHYQSIFAELSSISAKFNFGNELLPKKYMVNHYLSFKPVQNLELGVFEAIVFSRENHFELQYLNPVIFYRTLEHQLDSPDNVLLGVNGKWNIKNRVSIYGQFLLDEFRVDEFFSGANWWGNKFGLQMGIKCLNVFGIANLDAQLEINRVRPFTYSHWKRIEGFGDLTVSNYTHFNQPLAHPLGSNFTEFIFDVNYRLSTKITAQATFITADQGRNTDINFGSDPLIDNNTRNSDYDQGQNQGQLTSILMVRFRASYELTQKLNWDFEGLLRKESTSSTELNSTYIGTGFRYNVGRHQVDY